MTEQVLAVQRMQDYIEKHKTEEISLSDLARASLFSPWYAFRLFRNVLGLTPAEYIRKYRLTQAAKQLRGGEVTMYIVYCAVSLATLSVAALLWGVRLHGSLLAFLGSWVLTMLSTLSVVCWWAAWQRTPSRPASLLRSSISPCWSFPAQRCRSRSCQRRCKKSSAFSR